MSFIDDSNKSLKNRPFDVTSEKMSLKNSNVHYEKLMDEKSATYLSTRSSIFAACVMVAICLLVPYNYTGLVNLLLSLVKTIGLAFAYVLIWTFTFRFFEKPLLMPLNIMLNVLPAAVIAYLTKSVNAFECFCVLAGGVTSLTLMSDDKPQNDLLAKNGFSIVELFEGEFVKTESFKMADIISEIIIPCLVSVASSSLGILVVSFISRYGAIQNAGIRLLFTSLLVMAISFVVSKIRNNDYYFSSSKINDKYDLPSVSFPALRSFVLRRLRFIISISIICYSCYLSDYLCLQFNVKFTFIKYVVSLLLITAFAFARGKHTQHKAQYALELCLIYAVGIGRCVSIKSTLIAILAGVLVDLLLTGMLFTYKRTLVHSKRNQYVEGMPLILLSISLLLIVCAAVLDYWAVML